MKALLACFCLIMSFLVSGQKTQEINPILHDESFIAAFGTAPGESTNEQLRIQTHLLYVEQLLRNKPGESFTGSQQENRALVLDLLQHYAVAGKFPVNRDYPGERRPCFIDGDGTICAVGYLIEQTKGRGLAESINANHQYDFLADMNEPAIKAWADEYGLTLEECAMIQPTYGYYPVQQTYADIKTGYGVSSGVNAGLSIGLSIIQLSNWARQSKGLAYAGMISGTTQIVLGALNIKKPEISYSLMGPTTRVSYKNQNHLSYANIAIGTATLVTSALNFYMKRSTNKETRSAFNLYSYPGYNNSWMAGISFSRRI